MVAVLFLVTVLLFGLAYRYYGGFLTRFLGISDKNPTPAHSLSDGLDFVPAPAPVLFGHHFSSIAGAGPVVGPIIAGLAFGWLPVWLWIVLGTIFFGGAHDFFALVVSMRNRGKSIADIARTFMSARAYRLMLIFMWLCLVYVLTVFTDLTSATFKADGGVATSSILFMGLAVGFGLCLYRLKMSLVWASIFFVPLVFLGVWIGQVVPCHDVPLLWGSQTKTWSAGLLFYAFIASVTPVWILLQPRDYLSSFLLYASVIGGVIGILLGGFSLQYPAVTGWDVAGVGPVFPILFVTVACGAISGFHSIVAGGTSSKQIDRESHAVVIGYGGMLVEGLVAVIALSAIMMIGIGDPLARQAPLVVYGAGMAKFLGTVGIPAKYGQAFGILALSTFILTTLDTATRLARYILQEFFNQEKPAARYWATAVTLVLPAVFTLMDFKDAAGNITPAWKIIWPIFGATNQLLAGVALMIVAVWLRKTGKAIWFVALPMLFMLTMTVWALVLVMMQYQLNLPGVIGGVLLVLTGFLFVEAVGILGWGRRVSACACRE